MPATRPHHQHRGLRLQPVVLAFWRSVADRSPDCIAQIDLSTNDVVPGGRQGVFAVSHEHARAGIERVDDHLALGRPGDLDAPIEKIARNPGVCHSLTNRSRLEQEIRKCAGVQFTLARSRRRRSSATRLANFRARLRRIPELRPSEFHQTARQRAGDTRAGGRIELQAIGSGEASLRLELSMQTTEPCTGGSSCSLDGNVEARLYVTICLITVA